jgi:ADP-heptose:LPS heptosyltransferase
MKALVYHNGALGDFLTALPAIQEYRSVVKADQLTILCRERFGELAVRTGYVDSFINIEKYSFLFNEKSSEDRVRWFFSQFSHSLLFAMEDSPVLINARNQNHLSVLYQPPFPTEEIPIIDYHLSLFKDSGINSFSRFPSLALLFDGQSSQKYNGLKAPVIAIAPGSGSNLKNWPLERFQKIGDYLTQRGYNVFWLAGECEERFQFRDTDKVIRDMDLAALSKYLYTCALYIGNDSGITHLAAAAHCPVIAIFGASNPRIWAPRGPAPIKCIFKSTCYNFCQTNGRYPACNNECMQSIQVEDVIAEITTAQC